MAQVASTQGLDPYKNFKLRLWDGSSTHVGNKLSGLLPPEVVEYRAGNDPSTAHKSPGRNKYDSILVDRGITQSLAFSNWASQVWNYGSALGAEVSSANFRRSIYLELYDEAGQSVVTYRMDNGLVYESPASPPGGVIVHRVHPTRGSIQEQLAAIFESSLRRLRP